jgi:hypothetical protein
MNGEYDLFERLPDGSALWRGVGLEDARLQLKVLAGGATANELFALDVLTGDMVARINVSQ